MSYQTILLVADGIARLTLNRPDRLNSFNTIMHERFGQRSQALATAGVAGRRQGCWFSAAPVVGFARARILAIAPSPRGCFRSISVNP